MNIKESKIKLLKKYYKYSEQLLNILNKIEYNLNYVQNFEYTNYNLINIHSIIEQTFNFSFEHNYNILINNYNDMNRQNFNNVYSFVYKQLNNLIDYLENIIKIYSKYIKYDILLNILIKNLKLNTKFNNKYCSEIFLNYDFLIFNF